MKLRSYKDEAIWKEAILLLPETNRLNDEHMPAEKYMEWRGNFIHVDHYANPSSKLKVILLHGVGGNGRLLSFIGVPLHRNGFEVIAPDLPGYGLSIITGGRVNYGHWVDLVNDLINEELNKDKRPVAVFGLSAGGMLAYQAACVNKKVAGLIATNLLDQRIAEVRDGSATNKLVSRIGLPLLTLLAHLNRDLKLPMRFVANMNAIVNNDSMLKLLIRDKTSSGASVSVDFILSLIKAAPRIEPEEFDLCPFLLVHPGKDKWTPVKLSWLTYKKLKSEKRIVILDNAGHFPIEQPGLRQLEQATTEFLHTLLKN